MPGSVFTEVDITGRSAGRGEDADFMVLPVVVGPNGVRGVVEQATATNRITNTKPSCRADPGNNRFAPDVGDPGLLPGVSLIDLMPDLLVIDHFHLVYFFDSTY
jgi:hypothetical protein